MADYRLDDLARISGVSARNIRAYRERGLLDPPRRVGRSAYYDDYHVSQLRTISQLLRRGFNTAHIAEFFTSMRQGADLADILGIQRAMLGPPAADTGDTPEPSAAPDAAQRVALDIDPDGDEARKLLEYGLAELVDGSVVLVDRTLSEIVSRAPEQLMYVRAILRIVDSTQKTIDELATEVVNALEECVIAQFGKNYVPKAGDYPQLSQIVQDYRELGRKVVADHLEQAVQQHVVTAISNYTTGILLSGQLEPNAK